MKVLVADDTLVNRQVLQFQLRKDGHSVVFAEDGKQAVSQFEKEQPDLILMDLMMPEMDGKEATFLIKQQSSTRFVPVIFLTAVTDEEGLAECLASGGTMFSRNRIARPFYGRSSRPGVAYRNSTRVSLNRSRNLKRTVTARFMNSM
jgi:CheY-like chemotaxis protein